MAPGSSGISTTWPGRDGTVDVPPLILGVYEPARTHPVLHVLRHFFLHAGQSVRLRAEFNGEVREDMSEFRLVFPAQRIPAGQGQPRNAGSAQRPVRQGVSGIWAKFFVCIASASQKRRRKSGASHPYDPVRAALYSTNNIRPQLLQVTVWRPLLTLWRSWVGSDIRQPWQRSRSTLATARPPLDFRNVS